MLLPSKLYGIVGWPLAHSLSPRMHNAGFAIFNWPGTYHPWPITPEKLADFVKAVRTLPIHGVSVTIPHKEAVIPLLDKISPLAQRAGAVNTLYWDNDALCGENTDILGFLAPLQKYSLPSTALILGAGGAARAVLTALAELGVAQIYVSNRNDVKAQHLVEQWAQQNINPPTRQDSAQQVTGQLKTPSIQCVAWEKRTHVQAELIVNTTPLGMFGEHIDQSPFPAEAFAKPQEQPSQKIAYDLVYNPLETLFLRKAKLAGWETMDGLDMLIYQGIAQFRLWTGHEPDAAFMRNLLVRAFSF